MKFYNREKELEKISGIIKESREKGRLIVFQGRRRIGKTTLILKSLEKSTFLYFFVSKKTEKELITDFILQIKEKLKIPYDIKFDNIEEILKFLFDYSKKNHLIAVFDEFQNFKYIKPSIFSDFQKLWDLNKDSSKIAIFCIGSMFTLIKRIFTSYKEPLYNRANQIMEIKSFNIDIQTEFLNDLKLLSAKNLLVFYALFNGIPKYLELVKDYNLENKSINQIIKELFCSEDAYLIREGKNILIEEFGKSYENYFSILSAISSGKTSRNEISQFTGISPDSIGVYLDSLENFYELIERKVPILKKESSKLSAYKVKDNFLAFWFRYIYKKNYLIEIKNFKALYDFIIKDLDNFLGFIFEDFIKNYLILKNNSKDSIFNFHRLGSYWRRPLRGDNHDNNEIDIVAINEDEKTVLFGECKLSSKKISQQVVDDLIAKADKAEKINKLKRIYYFFTLNKLPKNKQKLLKENGFKWFSVEEMIR